MKSPLAIAEQAVAFLEALEGNERYQGTRAAAILRHALAKTSSNREAGLSELQYGLSGKGVLDWQWSAATFAVLDALSDEYYSQWVADRTAT